MEINIKNSGQEYKIQLPIESEIEKWNCSLDKNYLPDKNEFIEQAFEKTFGQELDAETIYKLVGRNQAVQEWLAETNAKFEISVQCPQYYKGLMSDEDYKRLNKDINSFNQLNTDQSQEIEKASIKYKDEIKKISEKYEAKKSEITKNPTVKVLTLDSTKLPISLSLAIENFTPQDLTDSATKKAYAREILIRYKQLLLEEINNGKDVELLIEEMASKF